MATYLQLPVLRITKYHLLLQRYLKLLDEDSFAYTQILEALDLMRQVNDQINKEMSSDLDKPFDDDLFETSAASNLNMLKLVGLFGSVLKQVLRKLIIKTKRSLFNYYYYSKIRAI